MIISRYISNFDLDKKIEQLEIVKLQTYDSSLFIGKSDFGNDRSLNSLIFIPTYKTFKMLDGLTNAIVEWESKGLSNEKITLFGQILARI